MSDLNMSFSRDGSALQKNRDNRFWKAFSRLRIFLRLALVGAVAGQPAAPEKTPAVLAPIPEPDSSDAQDLPPTPTQTPQTLIAQGMTIHGNMTVQGDLRVCGSVLGNLSVGGTLTLLGDVRGNINCKRIELYCARMIGNIVAQQSVSIGNKATVVGDVTAPVILSNGRVKGRLNAREMVRIGEGATQQGDVQAQSIQLDSGAQFIGQLLMEITPEELAPFETAGFMG
ncbi:MAG: polymer-forming cytoskeletal protein [Oscillospiraceae bacterium]